MHGDAGEFDDAALDGPSRVWRSKPKKAPARKTVESLKHDADTRKNIPTAELQAILKNDDLKPAQIRYPRNTDLDPQLVWRGKDEQDWSDLVVHAPPLYIQEKVHPKVLIEDLLDAVTEPVRGSVRGPRRGGSGR